MIAICAQLSWAQTAGQYYQAGVVYFQREQFPQAVEAFTKVIEMDATHALAYTSRGLVRYKLGDVEGAIQDHSKAIELDPSLSEAYTNRGGARLAVGDHKGAIADHTKSIELNPKSAEAYSNRGLVRLTIGDTDGAIADFDRALKLDPFYPRGAKAYANRATARLQKASMLKGKPAYAELRKAIRDSTNALGIDPKLAEAYNIRGLTYMKTIDLDPKEALRLGFANQALADFTNAIRIDPELALPYLNRGILRVRLNRFAGASSDLKKAVELNPRLKPAADPWLQWAESKQTKNSAGQTP